MPTYFSPMGTPHRMNSRYRLVDNSTGWISFNEYSMLKATAFGRFVLVQNSLSDWQKRIADGIDASTAYFRNGLDFKLAHTRVDARVPLGKASHYVSEGSNITLGPTNRIENHDTDLRDQALKRFKARLARNTGEHKLGAPLAELHEVRGMVTNAAEQAWKLVEALALIRKTKGRSAYKYASEKWLGFAFGVQPVLNDIQSGIKSVGDYLSRHDHNVRLYATASKYWTSGGSGKSRGPYGTWFHTDTTYQHSLSYRYIGAWDLLLESGNDYSIWDHLGLKATQLPAVAWELVPFSWILDYFGTVGDFLEDAFESPPGELKYLVCCRKYKMRVFNDCYYSPYEGTILSQKKDRAVCDYWEFERTPLGALPHRALRLQSADEIGKHVVSKLLNLVALKGVGVWQGRNYIKTVRTR